MPGKKVEELKKSRMIIYSKELLFLANVDRKKLKFTYNSNLTFLGEIY